MCVQKVISVSEVLPNPQIYVSLDTTVHQVLKEVQNFPALLEHTTTEQVWKEKKIVFLV